MMDYLGKVELIGELVKMKGRILEFPDSREKSLALTKLDECMMWLENAKVHAYSNKEGS